MYLQQLLAVKVGSSFQPNHSSSSSHATRPPVLKPLHLLRTLGYLPGVRVTPSIKPTQHSALLADRHCGKGTRLIYYMNPGELLSRPFTPKDTHSVKGDLLIVYAEVDRVGAYSVERTLATTSVLGFSSPSFSFGMDIILPAEINQELRDVLLSDPKAGTSRGKPDSNPEVRAVRAMDEFKGTFIPEVSESA